MRKLVAVMSASLLGATLVAPLAAQDHLLVTEFVVTPTAGEFIEIYNPTADSVNLTNYYLTDEVFNNNNNYINIVKGGFTTIASDFMVKFPDGVKIGPGQFITVAFSGAGFTTTYGVPSDFEIRGGDAAIPDMTRIAVGGSAGLSNDGEVIILFHWDGLSDLVQDVDIVLWGDKAEGVDKTGVRIDGPDADADSSAYLPDTPVAQQFVVNADNDDSNPEPHYFGMSAQRRLDVEDVEIWTGGNGITGHNETSENVSWKGGIWSINERPTPGRRAFGKPASDSLTVADVQFIREDDITALANDNSPFLGDTVEVTAIVMHGIRDIFVGRQFAVHLNDGHGGPWSGFYVIQDDSTVSGTNITAVQPGDKIRIKGRIQEFPTTANTISITESHLLLAPVTPVEFLEFGLPLPAPILLTPGDIGAAGGTADPRLSERWESTLVRFENLTVTANGLPGNIMTAGDETGNIAIDDNFNAIFAVVDPNNGVWPGFPPGTKINVTGFFRGGTTQGTVTINPRSLADVEILGSPPPEISGVLRNPVAVTSADNANISAIIFPQASVANATVHYRVDGGPYLSVRMTNTDSLFTAAIPAQANGAFVEYFLTAVNATGDSTSTPADTSAFQIAYFVRDAGITIFDLQFTPYSDQRSPYQGLQVSVTGVVTTDTSDFSFYWIQDGTDPWSGIEIFDQLNQVILGDRVTVTGTVAEFNGATEITSVSNVSVISSGNAVPGPVVLKTGDLRTGSPTAESYEGMLVRVENVGVVNPFPDSPTNFGEFTVDDGSGEVRVNDLSSFRGNLDSTFARGDSLLSVTGIHNFANNNYKMEPRNDNDVVRKTTAVESRDGQLPFTFALEQNYPNPFNPETTIRYEVARNGKVTLTIFNLLGQQVKTLIDKVQPAGAYTIQWDGTSDRGVRVPTGVYFYQMKSADFVKVHKMLLLQ